MKRLSKHQAVRCENAVSRQCQCRCRGVLHGVANTDAAIVDGAHFALENEVHDPGVQLSYDGSLKVLVEASFCAGAAAAQRAKDQAAPTRDQQQLSFFDTARQLPLV